MTGLYEIRLGNVVGKGLAGGTVHSVIDHPGLVAKVMRPTPENYKEVFVQIYVNRLDPKLSPMIHTYFKREGKLVVVMDRINATLENASKRGGRLTCPDARVVKGLVSRLHAIGVVHHDLHAGNIAVGSDGNPVVIDFGWADIFPAPISRNVNAALGAGKPFTNYGALDKWLEACDRKSSASKNSGNKSRGSANAIASPMRTNSSRTGGVAPKRTKSLNELRTLKVVSRALAKPAGVRKVRPSESRANHDRVRR